MSASGMPISSATTIIGRRLATAAIHSICPSRRPWRQSRSAAAAVNCSMARIRLAARCRTSSLRCTACSGSSAVANTWVGPPRPSMVNACTLPSGMYVMVAVRFEEKSSVRPMASLTASHPHTT